MRHDVVRQLPSHLARRYLGYGPNSFDILMLQSFYKRFQVMES
jgi:hypothetical protein